MGIEGALKPYKKQFDYSYAFGAFAAYELLEARPENIIAVYIHSGYTDKEKLEALCAEKKAPVIMNDRMFERLAQKENCMVFVAFSKYTCKLNEKEPHVSLVNPVDMGNLGSIIRSMAAFGFRNLAIITPAADVFDPKTIRASMGALFKINLSMFTRFDEYLSAYSGRIYYPFMTDGEFGLDSEKLPRPEGLYTLIFGNEAAGLPPSFADVGHTVRIPQTSLVDSLNLSVAVGIGLYEVSKQNNIW